MRPRTHHGIRIGAVGAAMMIASVLTSGCSSTRTTTAQDVTPESYSFWPLPPDEPRIQFVKSFRSSADVRKDRQSDLAKIVFGDESEQEAAIQKPYGVDLHAGKIYVCDIRRPGIEVLDLTNNQVRLVGIRGVNRLVHPVDVAVADDGTIYVADNERNAVIVFGPDERYARTIGRQGMKPVSVAVHGERLYVCDLTAQQVEIFDRASGDSVGRFGSVGDGDGEFRVPLGVDTDRQGNVYVSDMMRARVQKFTPDGEYAGGVGELGDYAGSFARPKQLAVDSEGIVYVVDSAFQNVQMFNEDFALLMSFGAAGNFPGALNLPAGIAVSDDRLDLYQNLIHPGFKARRLIAVTNQFGPAKVAIYALGEIREGWTKEQLQASSREVSAGVGENARLTPLQSTGDVEPGQQPPDESPPEEPGGTTGGSGGSRR
ncbi:MAG: hypothetical protein H6813_06800 [Phycisphaeraceae bacterium]|nr:hypothetical protein [Phycisphaeraceae bacterium]MCB9848643.1 hypothetical protein [Phycisphaeraceae bacterium]